MHEIPKGNTQKNVSKEVFKILRSAVDFSSPVTLLDVPCGDGSFGKHVKSTFPETRVIGVDRFCDVSSKDIEFYKLGAHTFFETHPLENVNAITSISGVMCFDGIERLLSHFHTSLKNEGLLVITNDNVMTVRDRLHFLIFGHFKRFKLIFSKHEGNWNLLLPQAIFMLMERHDFKNITVKYASFYVEDLFFLPLALIIYALFLPYLLLSKSVLPLRTRLMLFPFKMLIARHYIVSARK